MRTLILVVLFLAPLCASAQFATMNRQGSGRHAQLQLDFDVALEDRDAFYIRTDLYGQATFGAFGAYLGLPFTTSVPDQSDGVTAIGNLEVGGLYHVGLGIGEVNVYLGLVFPTAPSKLQPAIVNTVGAAIHPNDFIRHIPIDFGLRIGVVPRMSLGVLFGQIDLGLDIVINGDLDPSPQLLLNANIGVGVGIGIVSIVAELINHGNLSTDGEFTSRFIHTFGGGIQVNLPVVTPYFGVYTPLDEGAVGKRLFISVGARASLP